MSIKDRLKSARKKRGLSQDELADIVGCTQGLISKIERGDQNETSLIVDIANALKVRPEYLLCKDDIESTTANEVTANSNVIPIDKPVNLVPLFDYVQAGDFKEAFEDLGNIEYIVTDAKIRQYTYALRVDGDSMTPVFQPGMIVIVEPDMSPTPGDYVIAKNGDNEATLKQLVKDGSDWLLKPLNPQYPTKDASLFEIVGVVIQSQLVSKFK